MGFSRPTRGTRHHNTSQEPSQHNPRYSISNQHTLFYIMRFSTIKNDKGNLHFKQWEATKFFERIGTDANNSLIGLFRNKTTPERAEHYRRYSEIPHVYAAAELRRQENGALGIARFNGLVVLEVRQLMSDTLCNDVKQAAMAMPSTFATFIGATGTEVIILVSVARPDGSLPVEEQDVETFYAHAYHSVVPIYDALLPVHVTRMIPSLRHFFLLPLDEQPLTNTAAVPLRITDSATFATDNDDADAHLLALPEQRNFEEIDMTAYQNYERAYDEAARKVMALISPPKHQDNTWFKDFITGMATELYGMGWPEEEAVCHLWRHLIFKDKPGLTEDFVRTLVSAVYDEENARRRQQPPLELKESLMQQVIRRMENRYVFRYNTVMGYTEYRANHTWITPWRPVTDKVINTFTTDLQIAGLNVWNRDVKRYVHSTRIRDFDPIDDYLFRECSTWDGRDHIRALAATVPTDNASQWADWFHTWFLAMVAQWKGRDRRYGNAIVPLLISRQGMHKSAFCRSLLPPELRAWGYTDNLSLSEERPVHLAMSQMLLINLDEFNRISPQKQQGFLKNILQLPSVKVKRPYASHTEEVPRLASFIATTNISDVLADPTGSRRFLGVQVTGNINVSQTPNYAQLYAQAQAELNAGTRYWFDDAETQAIMEHNSRFQMLSSAEIFFYQYFTIPTGNAKDGQWMTTTEILLAIKQRAGSAFQVPAANSFGRSLRGHQEIPYRRSRKGSEFYVKPTPF
ncbi:MAG: DUF3874 domain-containing protein [Bacteroidaceae bacterium]|nr:DUF3874 domain-containing protein [Bacteroidaceae bacterium]